MGNICRWKKVNYVLKIWRGGISVKKAVLNDDDDDDGDDDDDDDLFFSQ